MDSIHMQLRFREIDVYLQLSLQRKRFKTKKLTYSEVKITLGTFLNFVYGSSYLGTKKSTWLLNIFWTTDGAKFLKLFLRSAKLKYRLS